LLIFGPLVGLCYIGGNGSGFLGFLFCLLLLSHFSFCILLQLRELSLLFNFFLSSFFDIGQLLCGDVLGFLNNHFLISSTEVGNDFPSFACARWESHTKLSKLLYFIVGPVFVCEIASVFFLFLFLFLFFSCSFLLFGPVKIVYDISKFLFERDVIETFDSFEECFDVSLLWVLLKIFI
jgi:hypothetical protein